MLKQFVNGKIHRLRVTALQPNYNGSCLIDPSLMEAAGIDPFEKVEIYSLKTKARISTYVFPGGKTGEFKLNGGAALHFSDGDEVVVVSYRLEEEFTGAHCVVVDPTNNTIAEVIRYESRPIHLAS
jgi:aspartate 1-decarboxylase